MPDPRYAHCPACAGGRVDCPTCDGEGIVAVDQEVAAFDQRQAQYVLAEYLVAKAEDEAARRVWRRQNARRIIAETLSIP